MKNKTIKITNLHLSKKTLKNLGGLNITIKQENKGTIILVSWLFDCTKGDICSVIKWSNTPKCKDGW